MAEPITRMQYVEAQKALVTAQRDRARALARSLAAALRDEHASNCRCQNGQAGGDCRTWMLLGRAEEHVARWPEPQEGDDLLSDIANVLTVYDEHVEPERRGPWRHRLAALVGRDQPPHSARSATNAEGDHA